MRIEASAGNDRSDDGGNGGVDDGGDGEKGRNEKKPAIKVTGMPGKHVPPGPGGVVGKMNDFLSAVSFSFVFCSLLSGFRLSLSFQMAYVL